MQLNGLHMTLEDWQGCGDLTVTGEMTGEQVMTALTPDHPVMLKPCRCMLEVHAFVANYL